MNNTYVLLDGDNILLDVFIKHVKPKLEFMYGTNYSLSLYCQTNLTFRYESLRSIKLSLSCTRTRTKNATDAQILFEAGKLIGESYDNIVIIVSNDKIFNEIVIPNKVILMGYENNIKRLRLTKENLLKVFREHVENRKDKSEDFFLEDYTNLFSKYSISTIKEHIQLYVPELSISNTNCIYYTADHHFITN
jgi:hypothetical protein